MLYVLVMANVRCPYCDKRVRFAPRGFGLPYCTNCGWRLRDAESSSQQTIFLMLALALLSLLLFFRTIILGWPLAIRCLFFTCFVAYPVLLGALSWLDYSKIIGAEPRTIAQKPEDWTLLSSKKYQPWLGLSIPRRTCISWNGWLRIAIGVACLMGVAYLLSIRSTSSDFGLQFLERMRAKAGPIGVLLAIGAWANLNLARQYCTQLPLLESGSAVIGRVLQQQYKNVRGRYSVVEYEFRDARGSLVSGQGQDYGNSLFQDSPVLVFYEAGDPSRNVALGCSLYSVKKHS
jgi:hypothetical protein